MPYTTGSQGAQTNCAKFFMENALHTAITGAGFTYVEEYIGASTNVSRIYKSPAGSNFFGQDWYLIIHRTSDTATSVNIKTTELYNSGTHKATNYAPNTGTYTPTAQFAVNDAAGQFPESATLFGGTNPPQISASGFQYWFSVTPDRVVLGTRVSTADFAIYVGLYDDLQASAISPFPLINGVLNVVGGAYGAATREPNQTTSLANCFSLGSLGGTVVGYGAGTTDTYTGKFWLGRLAVLSNQVSTRYRGYLRDVWYGLSGGVNGDTMTATIGGSSKNLVQVAQVARTFIDTAI